MDPLSRTVDWLWIRGNEVDEIKILDDNILGRKLIECLSRSKFDIPHPPLNEHRDLIQPLLRVTGAKNWAGIVKGAKGVGVQLEDNLLTFEPQRNLGVRGGFEPVLQKIRTLKLSEVSQKEIGQALLDALEDAE